MKTAHKGEGKFHVMSLEEPDEANAEGLKAALETSILKLGVNIEREKMYLFLWVYIFIFASEKLYLARINDPFILLCFKLFFKKVLFSCVLIYISKIFFVFNLRPAKKSRNLRKQVGLIYSITFFIAKVVTIFFESLGVFLLSFGIF